MAETVVKTKPIFYKTGEIIFREGDIGEKMYIIKSGRVEVVKKIHDEEIVLATLNPNSFFGEMALFGDKHRTATVRAIEDSEMISINKRILDVQLLRVPDWFVAIMRTLVLRLKETNKRLKSRYTISLEYSLLKIFFWIIHLYGKQEKGGTKAQLGPVFREVQAVLGVSKEEVMTKLKDFSFVQLIKFSEAKNEILIPDVDKLKDFLLFLQAKKDKKTRLTHSFETLQKDTVKMQYFEKIHRLLVRKKGENAGA